MKLLKTTAWLFKALNVLVVAALLTANLSPYVSPATFWPLAFLALAYPTLIGINAAFALWWLLKRKSWIWLSVGAIAVGFFHMPNPFAMHAGSSDTEDAISVMSFNCRLFDLYSWTPEATARNDIHTMLRTEDPDVVCFQEYLYYDCHNPEFTYDTRDSMLTYLSAKHYHEEFTFNVTDKFRTESTYRIGMATYSRYPIVRHGSINFSKHTNNLVLFTDLLMDGDTVRVYNVHLASVRLDKTDRELSELLGEEEGTKRVVSKLKNAFEIRAHQADSLAQHIAACPYPTIVAGDFNDVPTSYTYKTLSKGLTDAHLETGVGMGSTLRKLWPGLRIDYVLHSADFEALECKLVEAEFSDHRPVVARLKATTE